MARRESERRYDRNVKEKADAPLATKLRDLIPDAATSAKLQEHLGVTSQAINQYKQGTAFPKTENLIKIADFFGISLDYLLGRTTAPTYDADIQIACKTTGLSESAINNLKGVEDAPRILSALLENEGFCALLEDLTCYPASVEYLAELLSGFADPKPYTPPTSENPLVAAAMAEAYKDVSEEWKIHDAWDIINSYNALRLDKYDMQTAFASIIDQIFPSADVLSKAKAISREFGGLSAFSERNGNDGKRS